MKKMLIMLPFKKRKKKKTEESMRACMRLSAGGIYIYINLGREKWELGWEGMIGRSESWEDRDRQ
jgi:hypothetical protein